MRLLTLLASSVALTSTAEAQFIIAPIRGTVDVNGPGFGPLSDTFNQSGLTIGYTAGVTNFDAYLASNPIHRFPFAGNEWFSSEGVTSAQVTYDLGAIRSIDRLALWNEDAAGIGSLNVLGSTDGVAFAPLLVGVSGTDTPINFDYPADVFAFAATSVQYVRFEMTSCPQPDGGLFAGCAIGEVAFRTAVSSVPEPATALLLAPGLLAAGVVARRRRA